MRLLLTLLSCVLTYQNFCLPTLIAETAGQSVMSAKSVLSVLSEERLHQDWMYQDHGLNTGQCFADSATVMFHGLTDDQSTGISESKTYTHLLDYGKAGIADGAKINGVAFQKTTERNGICVIRGEKTNYGWKNGLEKIWGNIDDDPAIAKKSGLHYLLSDCNYGQNTEMQLTGLTAGKTYEVRLYCRKYNNENRTFPITFDTGNGNQVNITYNYNQRTPHALVFRYIPQDSTLTIRFGKATHNYDIHALTNEELAINSSLFKTNKNCSVESAMVRKVLDELDVRNVDTKLLRDEMKLLQDVSGNDSRWKMLYLKACEIRRQLRIANWVQQNGINGQLKIVYTKHCVLSGPCQMHPTDMVTDNPYKEQIPDFRTGAQLRLLTLVNHKVSNNLSDVNFTDELLLETKTGLIRDPNVSYDGKRIVFSMRNNIQTDDYNLYEIDVSSREVTQLTNDVAVSDVEPSYLPDGNIIFQSTRCVQLTDCWPVPVSNLYIFDIRNKNIRRVGFDQVHTLYPQVLDSGTVIYTRWEYNDRNPVHQQPLFQMDYDGTAQQVFYGGGEYFPTAIIHARGVPNTNKVIGIASGHHVDQRGKLIMIDRAKGTDGNSGIEFLAPRRKSDVPVWKDSLRENDQFGQDGETFQYPFATDEDNYLVAYIPEGGVKKNAAKYPIPFGLYWMNSRGERELLAYDSTISCGQPVVLAARNQPKLKPPQVDLTQKTGKFYIQDVYVGKGTEGVKRGTIKSMRVVALEYRAAHVRDGRTAGRNKMFGARGSVDRVTTPIAAGSGSWDVKRILGEVPVTDDGNVFVEVPAQTPVYFQLLDENGYCVQTMRSWTTLQPNETFACIGCHEDKLSTFNGQRAAGKSKLYSVNNNSSRGFSYSEMIQPIWDKHCIRCHNEKVNEKINEKINAKIPADDNNLPFAKIDLRGVVHSDLQNDFQGAKEHPWQSNGRLYTVSYLKLTNYGVSGKLTNWVDAESRPQVLPPYFNGSSRSPLMKYLDKTHYDVNLSSEEKRTVAAWIDICVPFCGSYTEANAWTDKQKELYKYFMDKRQRLNQVFK
jgi:hypothetical protein